MPTLKRLPEACRNSYPPGLAGTSTRSRRVKAVLSAAEAAAADHNANINSNTASNLNMHTFSIVLVVLVLLLLLTADPTSGSPTAAGSPRSVTVGFAPCCQRQCQSRWASGSPSSAGESDSGLGVQGCVDTPMTVDSDGGKIKSEMATTRRTTVTTVTAGV
eukprot:1220547-Rhodomonas_salina.2